MSREMLEKELSTLPEDSLQKVYEYVLFLKFTYPEAKKRSIGTLVGDFISMADDFDETLVNVV